MIIFAQKKNKLYTKYGYSDKNYFSNIFIQI
jgi:hypothetical protein